MLARSKDGPAALSAKAHGKRKWRKKNMRKKNMRKKSSDGRPVKLACTLEIQKPVDGFVRVFPVNVKKKTALVDLPQGSFTEGPRIELPTKELVES